MARKFTTAEQPMSPLLYIKRYMPQDAPAWNAFLQASANGTFLHDRRFVEYHADRFEDHSLIARAGDKIVAVLPANRVGETLHSHGGLTYGGFVVGPTMSAALMIEIVAHLREVLPSMGFKTLAYKAIPHIFHRYPAEQDVYALVQAGGQLVRCDLSSVIAIGDAPSMSQSKRRGVKRAHKAGLEIKETSDFAPFWSVLETRLVQAHETSPTHSLSEIEHLKAHFPENIRLFTAQCGDDVQAGVLMFDCGPAVHVQYMATTEEGRDNGALDLIIVHLIQDVFSLRRWFDFGVSTTQGGRCLNVGLAHQKERFGARSVMFNHYEWTLK